MDVVIRHSLCGWIRYREKSKGRRVMGTRLRKGV